MSRSVLRRSVSLSEWWATAEVSVNVAVSIVFLTAVIGYAIGLLFGVHVVSDPVEAVWASTVLSAAVGLSLWAWLRS